MNGLRAAWDGFKALQGVCDGMSGGIEMIPLSCVGPAVSKEYRPEILGTARINTVDIIFMTYRPNIIGERGRRFTTHAENSVGELPATVRGTLNQWKPDCLAAEWMLWLYSQDDRLNWATRRCDSRSRAGSLWLNWSRPAAASAAAISKLPGMESRGWTVWKSPGSWRPIFAKEQCEMSDRQWSRFCRDVRSESKNGGKLVRFNVDALSEHITNAAEFAVK